MRNLKLQLGEYIFLGSTTILSGVATPFLWLFSEYSYLLSLLSVLLLISTLVGAAYKVISGRMWMAMIYMLPVITIIACRIVGLPELLQELGFRVAVYPANDYAKSCNVRPITTGRDTYNIGICRYMHRLGLYERDLVVYGLRSTSIKTYTSDNTIKREIAKVVLEHSLSHKLNIRITRIYNGFYIVRIFPS